jgi:hypothetical protein
MDGNKTDFSVHFSCQSFNCGKQQFQYPYDLFIRFFLCLLLNYESHPFFWLTAHKHTTSFLDSYSFSRRTHVYVDISIYDLLQFVRELSNICHLISLNLRSFNKPIYYMIIILYYTRNRYIVKSIINKSFCFLRI